MSPQEALQLLDGTVAAINATRTQHVQLQTAVQVLDAHINQPVEKPAKAFEAKKKK